MYFPSTITVLGREFKLIFQEEVLNGNKPLGGMVDFETMEIFVDSTMTERNQWVALFHEVVHIGCDVSGIDQTLSPFAIEVICQTLGNTFYDLVVSFQKPKRGNKVARKRK